MEAMQPVLEDAEMRATKWPMRVRQAAYDVTDIVDELQNMRKPPDGLVCSWDHLFVF
jgi:hypothetical protein